MIDQLRQELLEAFVRIESATGDESWSPENEMMLLTGRLNRGILKDTPVVARWKRPHKIVYFGVLAGELEHVQPASVVFIARNNQNLLGQERGRGFSFEGGRIIFSSELLEGFLDRDRTLHGDTVDLIVDWVGKLLT